MGAAGLIYVDTSAMTKLLLVESETADLRAWLAFHSAKGDHVVTSDLCRVELMRVVARQSEPGPPTLRSLDAIHLAAAVHIGRNLTAFVTYDRRFVGQLRRSRPAGRLAWRGTLIIRRAAVRFRQTVHLPAGFVDRRSRIELAGLFRRGVRIRHLTDAALQTRRRDCVGISFRDVGGPVATVTIRA